MKLVVNMIMGRFAPNLTANLVCTKLLTNMSILDNYSRSCFPNCSMMAAFSEGLLLSEKVGLDPNDVVEVDYQSTYITFHSMSKTIQILRTSLQ